MRPLSFDDDAYGLSVYWDSDCDGNGCQHFRQVGCVLRGAGDGQILHSGSHDFGAAGQAHYFKDDVCCAAAVF
jgi:hypothetical protein